jgi:anti-sigma factor RsiW
MNAETAEKYLPCFVCGDLPPDMIEAVAAAVAADPHLRAQVDRLRQSREACREALAESAPELDFEMDFDLHTEWSAAAGGDSAASGPTANECDDGVRDSSAVEGREATLLAGASLAPAPGLSTPVVGAGSNVVALRPTPGGPLAVVLALAACASLMIGFMGGGSPDPAEVSLSEQVLVDAHVAPLQAGDSKAEIIQGLLDAGAPPSLARAADLSAMGFELVGARVLDGDRSGVVAMYEKDGQRFACQMFPGFSSGGRPDVVRSVNGVTVRGFDTGDMGGVVAWTNGGMTCIFSGPAPLETLMLAVVGKLSPTRG